MRAKSGRITGCTSQYKKIDMLVSKRKETNTEQLFTKKLVALIGLIANRLCLNSLCFDWQTDDYFGGNRNVETN